MPLRGTRKVLVKLKCGDRTAWLLCHSSHEIATALRVQLATFFPELKRPTRHGDLADMDENAEMETWE